MAKIINMAMLVKTGGAQQSTKKAALIAEHGFLVTTSLTKQQDGRSQVRPGTPGV
jgi:hypothetical protein